MRKKRKLIQTVSAAVLGLVCFSIQVSAAGDSVYTKTDFVMDTFLTQTIYTSGEDITDSVTELLSDMETRLLSWTDENSEIYRLNETAGNPAEVSEELLPYLTRTIQLSKDSGGALEPTLGKVIRLWDIGGENPSVPEQADLDALMQSVGYEKISLTDENVLTMEEGCTLDLGAVGKGMGCDRISEYLSSLPEIEGALINLGGSSVMAYGSKPDGSLWKIAVTDPRDTDGDYLGVVSLEGGEFLSTSGDYEKYFVQDGVRYHHILDPSTGYPVQNGICSVTVICSSGLYADGLSTACFVLGKEKGMELLEKYGADGMFVDEQGCIYLSDGMKERFEQK